MTPTQEEVRTEREERLSTADLANNVGAGAGTAAVAGSAARKVEENNSAPLFAPEESKDMRTRWERIQIDFVDEPRGAVQKADELVASAIKRLAEVFADERNKLEADWARGGDVSTEDLRVALRRYRSFFDRLLSV